MFDFFGDLMDFIGILIDFIISFFRDVIQLVSLVFKSFAYLGSILNFIPLQYKLVLTAILSYSLIMAVVHFGGD